MKLLPTREGWQTAIDNLVKRTQKHNVDITINWTPEPEELTDEVVIVATGSYWTRTGYSPYRPERAGIPIFGDTKVVDISTAILESSRNPQYLGKKVVIIDETGDYLPLGLSEILGSAGVDLELISPRPFVGSETQRTLDMPHLLPRLKKLNVKFSALSFVEKIAGNDVHTYDIWGGPTRVIEEVESVVIAMTRLPNDHFYLDNTENIAGMKRIGDVLAPRKIEAVIFEAEKTARTL